MAIKLIQDILHNRYLSSLAVVELSHQQTPSISLFESLLQKDPCDCICAVHVMR